LLEIVDELQQAKDDGTLPDSLSLPKIWLDREGHAKLLDNQLVNLLDGNSTSVDGSGIPGPDRSAVQSPTERAVGLVQELGDLFHRTTVLPSSVQDFLIELAKRPKTDSTLQWAKEHLAAHSNRVESLTWDSRLGVLSATVGIELIVYGLVAIAIFLFCYFVAPLPNAYRFIAGLGLGLIFPMVLSCWFQGGPVFQFMGIQVCNLRGRKSHGLICAIRAAISWMPVIALLGVFILSFMLSETQARHLEPVVGTLTHDLKNRPAVLLGVIVVAALSTLSLGIGLLIAVASPKKGLVDFLLRTRLMPK
jgi:hypothetical protein